MKLVGKHNLFKGISLALTAGVPLITSALVSDFLVRDTNTSISTAGVIAILITCLMLKDKLLEQIKTPTAFKFCLVLLIITLLLESILIPIKVVLIASCISMGIDELIFKPMYLKNEKLLGESAAIHKRFGFYFCKTKTILGDTNE